MCVCCACAPRVVVDGTGQCQYLLPVKGVFARANPQLILLFELLQAHCTYLGKRHRERERDIKRERETKRERERETERERQRERHRETERDKERDIERDRERHRERDIETERETERHRERQRERASAWQTVETLKQQNSLLLRVSPSTCL